MASLYKVKTITDIEQVNLLEMEWRSLTEGMFNNTAHNNNEALQCFMSWEWLTQWLETYKDYINKLKVICISYHDECIAILPFYISIHSFLGITTKTLALIATNEPEECEIASEFIDAAYSHNHKQKIIELLSCELIKLTDITQFNFRNLNKKSLVYTVCNILKAQNIPYQEHIVGYQFYRNMSDKYQYSISFLKKKKRMLNRFKQISESQNGQFIIANKKEQALKLYEQLVDLHQKRWQKKNKPGVFSNNYFYEYHRRLINQYFQKGMIILSAIQIEKKVISVNYSIQWHNTLYFYQGGIDESYKPNLSPGLLNHLLLIEYCKEHHIQQYNLLKSAQSDYKSQFSQQGDQLIDITMLLSNKLNLFWLILHSTKRNLKKLMKLFK